MISHQRHASNVRNGTSVTLVWPDSAGSLLASRLEDVIETAQHHADEATVPDDLGALVAERMRTDHALAWDDVVRQLVLERATGRPERDPWSSAP